MKKYKTQHKTLSFLVFHIIFVGIGLVFGITPEGVIESCATELGTGNVLAYYNRYNRIIVLKNGGYRKYCVRDDWDWSSESANMCQRVFEPTLAEIIAFSTGKPCQEYCHFYFNDYREYMSAKEIKESDVRGFLELILKESNHFSEHIINETARSITRYLEVAKEMPKERIKNSSLLDLRWVHIFKDYGKSIDETPFSRNNNFSKALAEYCKANNSNQDGWEVNLCPLGNFQHTEIQLEALYSAYKEVVKYLKKTRPWRDYQKANNTKIFLENLLPVILTEPNRDDIDRNIIYSLYEACNVCRQANWLQDKKEIFKFKVVDRQGQVEREEGRFYVLDEMATQTALEVWQEQNKEEKASIESFAPGHFVSKPKSDSKDCESNENKIENNF